MYRYHREVPFHILMKTSVAAHKLQHIELLNQPQRMALPLRQPVTPDD